MAARFWRGFDLNRILREHPRRRERMPIRPSDAWIRNLRGVYHGMAPMSLAGEWCRGLRSGFAKLRCGSEPLGEAVEVAGGGAKVKEVTLLLDSNQSLVCASEMQGASAVTSAILAQCPRARARTAMIGGQYPSADRLPAWRLALTPLRPWEVAQRILLQTPPAAARSRGRYG
jgi:hypothetical protein